MRALAVMVLSSGEDLEAGRALIRIPKRACARAAGISAGSASTCGGCRRRRAFRRYGENRELRLKFFVVTFRAFGFFLAVNERLELVMAFLADVLEDGHERLQYLLESICGEFANLKFQPRGYRRESERVGSARAFPSPPMARRRPCADDRQFPAAAKDSLARS